MAGRTDEAVRAGVGATPGHGRTPAGRKIGGLRARQGWPDGLFRPVHYARSRDRYRPPPDLYRRLSRRIGPAATSLGLVPDDVITLQVPGRRSGVIRRTTMVRAVCDGCHYVVSLAGESDWVRNVRAAGGQVVIGGRPRRAARLTEVPVRQRAPVIRAYLLRWGRRPGSRAVAREARYYFGVGPQVPLDQIQGVAENYPVFRIDYAGKAGRVPVEIAPGVYRVEIGRGLAEASVYLVRSGPGWGLIDTAWPHRAQLIKAAAESLFGAGTRPAAIVLTHIHPDHSGSALELARMWDLPVYVHPDELVLAPGGYLPEYGNPLDRWLIAPVLRLLPRRMVEASRVRNSLEGTARAFDPAAAVPGLPDWQAVPTPGHTPGHVAFFRKNDRVLITGDAVLTVNLNSVPDLLAGRQRVSGPPYISTWDWPAARQSVAALARLEPDVLACGHGRPMAGPGAAAGLASFSGRFCPQPAAGRSRDGAAASTGRAGRPARLRARVSWGATSEERTMALPADELVPSPVVQATHAVTINAPRHRVWPWLVQTGQGGPASIRTRSSGTAAWTGITAACRAGSRGRQRPAITWPRMTRSSPPGRIRGWATSSPMGRRGPPPTSCVRPSREGPLLFTDTHLRYLLPARLRGNPRLGIHGEISDCFLLTEPEPGTTRLVRRMRLSCRPWLFRAYAVPVVLVWGEAITAQNLLRGIKRRAETTRQPS